MIVPLGTAHVGCVADAVGTIGAVGTALIVIVVAPCVEHVLSAMLRTRIVYEPGARPENEVPAW